MKIAIAQIKPDAGAIRSNMDRHIRFIEQAHSRGADAIFFPELSITGYEPALAKQSVEELRNFDLTPFSDLSTRENIVIGLGAPTSSGDDICISMLIFLPNGKTEIYSKQQLHKDEQPFFSEGIEQRFIQIGNHKIAPAICYESLQTWHSRQAVQHGTTLYLASVAKSQKGVDKAYQHFSAVAKKNTIPVLMANCAGYCDNFESAGSSAVWSASGKLLAKLGPANEGLLVYDTESDSGTVVV